MVKKTTICIIVAVILLVSFIIGKEIYHNKAFLGLLDVAVNEDAANNSHYNTDDKRVQNILSNEQDNPIHWITDIKYEEGKNDKPLYICQRKYDGDTLLEENYNDGFETQYIKSKKEPSISHILEVALNKTYCIDLNINKNSFGWQYEGTYLGCDFRAEHLYIVDDTDNLTTKITNVKWKFRDRYIKIKQIDTNADYDFENQLRGVIE